MRSRSVRLAIGLMVVIALGGSAYFLFNSEERIAGSRAALRAYDAQTGDARLALADLRAAQQAYVAAGQQRDFWMPKVDAARASAAARTTALRGEAVSDAAKTALDEVADALKEFGAIDTRVRDYLAGGQDLMAADVVFTEGSATAAAAARGLETARAGEQGALDALESGIRRQELYALAGAGAFGALAVLLLAATGAASRSIEEIAAEAGLNEPAVSESPKVPGDLPLMKATAELCTDFGRVRSLDDLQSLLGRAAKAMDASGLVVWMGSPAGADLRPVLAHGYSAAAIARMPAVPRSANNAAAAAYRSGALQIVLSKPGSSAGAVVAPLVSPEGCVGALSIEIKGGHETSDGIQAMAGIFAAQLSGVLSASASAEAADTPIAGSRTAAG